MSVQAMSWAMRQTIVTDAPGRHVLLCLANYASVDGRSAWPTVGTLAHDTGLSERTVQTRLAALKDAGVIRLGNQAVVAAYVGDPRRRPTCYDLALEMLEREPEEPIRGARDAPHDGVRGAAGADLGVQDSAARGAAPAPKPYKTNHQALTEKLETPDGVLSPAGGDAAADDQGGAGGRLNSGSGVQSCPHLAIVDAWHRLLPELQEVHVWGEDRRKHLQTRWKSYRERQELSWWEGLFNYIRESDFLMGRRTDFTLTLPWLIKSEENLVKVVEGNYHGSRSGA